MSVRLADPSLGQSPAILCRLFFFESSPPEEYRAPGCIYYIQSGIANFEPGGPNVVVVQAPSRSKLAVWCPELKKHWICQPGRSRVRLEPTEAELEYMRHLVAWVKSRAILQLQPSFPPRISATVPPRHQSSPAVQPHPQSEPLCITEVITTDITALTIPFAVVCKVRY